MSSMTQIAWIPRVPPSWSVQRAKTVLYRAKSLNRTRAEQQVLSLTLRGVVENDPENPQGLVPEDYATYQIFERDDLVFKLIDLENVRTSRVGLVHKRGIMSSAYLRLRPRAGVSIRFLYWSFFDLYNRQVFNQLGNGVRSTLSAEDVLDLPLLIPNLDVQRAIADFLDVETTRIDALIAKKRQMVTSLRDRQVASEAAAVLRSGTQETSIPSLPSVPEHWKVLRNKVFMREVNEPSVAGDEEMLSVSHLTGVTPRSEKTVYMFEAESTVGYKTVKPGDLVINTMWAWMGAAGVAKVSGIVSPAYGVYRIDQSVMTPDYFDVLIRTGAYIAEMTRYSRGVTASRLRLYPEEFLALRSPVPPLEEQVQVVEACFAQRASTSAQLSILERQIDLLLEHRQALITAAVTGEIEIPMVAA